MGLERETPRPALVGRGDLLDHLEKTLRGHGRAALTGPPGIGKTALVAAVVRPEERRARGETVLWLAPEEEDRDIPGVSAAGLLDDVPEAAVRELPRPQRTAVAVARRETEAPAAGQDRVALRLAVAQVLRLLAAEGPVLLVVDNAQWLDPESSALLRFALHKAPCYRTGPGGRTAAHQPAARGEPLRPHRPPCRPRTAARRRPRRRAAGRPRTPRPPG
ncbi:ATP-binding protein [Streptomyces radiopugnans]|nr:ATP-binding protein [Streptomyces radiopugnans]